MSGVGTRLLRAADGFSEDAFVGRTLRTAAKAVLAVTDRDERFKMVMLDPDTAKQAPMVLRAVNRGHGNKAGVHGAVLVAGTARQGDEIVLAE